MIEQAILSVLLTVILGELIKFCIALIRREPAKMFRLGGMPSMHSAAVMALIISIYFETGTSLLLLVTIVFGFIVMRDAFGLRWEISQHGKAINKILKKEECAVVGHTRYEVLAGAILGTLVTLTIYAMHAGKF